MQLIFGTCIQDIRFIDAKFHLVAFDLAFLTVEIILNLNSLIPSSFESSANLVHMLSMSSSKLLKNLKGYKLYRLCGLGQSHQANSLANTTIPFSALLVFAYCIT